MIQTVLRRPFDDLMLCMERLVDSPPATLHLTVAFVGLILTWFVYVPVHELLHVAGCVATGGSVTQLEIQAIYGGEWLAEIFDFIAVGGEYSGRLSGFDTGGSDAVYLATDLAPYLLSIFPGVLMLRLGTLESRPIRGALLFGAGVTLGFAPFYNILGDYYEMASILLTRTLALVARGGAEPPLEALRSDDVIALIGRLVAEPSALGLENASDVALASVAVGASLIGSVALAFATYEAGRWIADRMAPLPPRDSTDAQGSD